MKPPFKNKYQRRAKVTPTGNPSLRRSPRAHHHSSNNPSLPISPTSSFSSNSETITNTHNLLLDNPLEAFANMVLSHEEGSSQPPSSLPMTVDKLPREDEPSPENMATAEGAAIGDSGEERNGTAIETSDVEPEKARSDPSIKSSPATASSSSTPITTGARTEVKSFDLNKPPGDWMKASGDFDSLFGDKPYYTTMLNGQPIKIYKPPHMYIKNQNLVKPISINSNFESGSGSGTSVPNMAHSAVGHGSTHGSNNRGTPPPIYAMPLRTVPPPSGRLFDVLGIPPEFEHSNQKPSLNSYQMSLIENLARVTPGNPTIDFSGPFSPPPTGGVKRPSGVVFQENPATKKVFKNQPINAFQFESWKVDQDRQRILAVEKAEKRVYTQLWGTISTLRTQCFDQNKKILEMEQQIADHGLADLEYRDRIDNLEMLLGLAIKSLKMDAHELVKYRNLVNGDNNESDKEKSPMHDIRFGSFTPEELNVLHGRERLEHLNRMLQQVGSGVGCSELAIVTKGCCNRLVVSGNIESLGEEEKEERMVEKEKKKVEKEEEKKKKESCFGWQAQGTDGLPYSAGVGPWYF